MYTEFLIIYIGLGAVLIMTIANLALLIALLRKNNSSGPRPFGMPRSADRISPETNKKQYVDSGSAAIQGGGVVVCKNCSTRYDSSRRICPRCGTPR